MTELNNEYVWPMLQKMVQLGALVREQENVRSPLFIYCAKYYPKNPQVIQYYIDAGLDVNQKDENGWTCIHGAAKAGDFETMKLLMKA